MFIWWPKGRIRGEYRDPMTGTLLKGSVSIATPIDLRSSTNKVVIPKGRIFHEMLNVDESLGHSFDFEVYSNLEGVDETGWGWIVIVNSPAFYEVTPHVNVVTGETTDMSEL